MLYAYSRKAEQKLVGSGTPSSFIDG